MDNTTKKNLRVSTSERGTSWIRLPVSQLDEAERLLKGGGFRYWVSENYVSWNGGPEMAKIFLGSGVDPAAVQAILDGAE